MFDLMEKSVKNEIAMSEDLQKATTKINNFHKIAKNSLLAISLILSDIADKPKQYLESSKFNTISEYAEEIFGYKKSYTYKLIKIAKFIKIKDLNGENLSVSDLINDKINCDYSFETLVDSDDFEFSPSQLLELIPLTEEQIRDNIKELDSSLTCKELRSIVKEIISPPIEITGEAVDSKEDSTEDSTENKEEILPLTDKERILQMLEICSSMENGDIKEKIVNVFQKSLKALEK